MYKSSMTDEVFALKTILSTLKNTRGVIPSEEQTSHDQTDKQTRDVFILSPIIQEYVLSLTPWRIPKMSKWILFTQYVNTL